MGHAANGIEATLVSTLVGLGVPFEYADSGSGAGLTLVAELPGEHKLKIPTAFTIGTHSVAINAFVVRAPKENVQEVHRWLLSRNRRLFAVSYAIDHYGDVYLVARMPLEAITAASLDAILGAVAATADGDFDTLLEMGFEQAIRDEWLWRLSRGESTRNLEAFRHLAPSGEDTAGFAS
jgi:Putative bacterial sensory transduction regulator